MPATQRSVRVDVELSGRAVDLSGLEEATLDFARRAPGELVAAAVQMMTGQLFGVSCCFRGSICLQVTSRVRIGSGSVVPGATLRRRSMASPSPRPELESGVGRRPSENRSEAEARSGP